MKIVLIGATGQSVPALFRSLAGSSALPKMEFALVARNLDRLKVIARAIQLISPGSIFRTHDISPDGLTQALDGATVIVIQARYGGLAGRNFDEMFPLTFAICGDEGLGPGGLSAACRSWPQLSELLLFIQQSAPVADILLLTSPSSLLTRLAGLSFPRLKVRAFCELPMTTLREAVGNDTVDCSTYDYFGINHLGWIYGLAGKSPIPLKYWRLHEEREAVLAEQRARPKSRASELDCLGRAAMEAFAMGAPAQVGAAIDARPAPWYSDALAPLLESCITRSSPFHFFFSEANGNWSASFPGDDILEIPYCWQDGNLVRKPLQTQPPQEYVATLAPFVEYERLAASAVLTRQRRPLENALAQHPWVHSEAQASGLAEVIVTQRFECEAAA